MKIGDDPTCPYHFLLDDIASVVYMDGLDIDASSFGVIGGTIANALRGFKPILEKILREQVIKTLPDIVFTSIKQHVLELSLHAYDSKFRTDQRYVGGINIRDNKIIANWDGFPSLIDEATNKPFPLYQPTAMTPVPKNVYTDREYELFSDHETIDLCMYSRHASYDDFSITCACGGRPPEGSRQLKRWSVILHSMTLQFVYLHSIR